MYIQKKKMITFGKFSSKQFDLGYFYFQITRRLQHELNHLYTVFCSRHPYFEANGGKVSIVAHSLGIF